MLTDTQKKEFEGSLKTAGIKKFAVKKPNSNQDFEIEVERYERAMDRLVVRPGKVDIKVFPDAKTHQVVIWADEKARTTSRTVSLSNWRTENRPESEVRALFEAGREFGITLPEGTTYKVLGSLVKSTPFASNSVSWSAKVEAHVPASELTLLVGVDESHLFICALPKRVKTVANAHKALRPAGLPANTPRQGEWFFKPVNKTLAADIEDAVVRRQRDVGSYWLDGERWLPGYDYTDSATTHRATTGIFLKEKLYVHGYIFDDRINEGLPSRHEPLYLADWHEVVRNLEIEVEGVDGDRWD